LNPPPKAEHSKGVTLAHLAPVQFPEKIEQADNSPPVKRLVAHENWIRAKR
jgi:hypothetical protein